MTKKAIRRPFTLLEIMIALMVISIIGALTAVQAKKLIDVHRFESKIAGLFITLQEAQLLSAVYQTDFGLDIDVGKEGVTYCFKTDEPFKTYKFKQGTVKLPSTTVVKFKDAKVTKLHFDIYSGGRIEPEGILAFYPEKENEKAFWFDLQHGFLLKFSHNKPAVVKRHVPSPPKQV